MLAILANLNSDSNWIGPLLMAGAIAILWEMLHKHNPPEYPRPCPYCQGQINEGEYHVCTYRKVSK